MRDKLSRLWMPISIALLLLCSFVGTALAATQATGEDQSLLDLARPVLDAIVAGQYWIAAALAVVLLTAAAAKYLPDAYGGKYVRSSLGKMATAALMSFAGGVATWMTAHGVSVPSAATFAAAGHVALAAIGGWMILHKLATELTATKWYAGKAPAWLKALLAFVLSIVGSSAAVKAKAEAAGEAAVAANPAPGTTPTAGEPTDI